MTPGLLDRLPKTPLANDEEQRLARMLSDTEASERAKGCARETLVLHSMLEAFSYAQRCCRGGLPADELISLCYSALCRAVLNFKPGRIRFFSYCKVVVRGEISREWTKKSIVRNVPGEKMESLTVLAPAEDYVRHTRTPDDAQTTQPEFGLIHDRETWELLAPLLESKLNTSERTVVTLRYLQDLNFRQIGSLLGITRQGAQSLHVAALKKLRVALARSGKIL